MSGRARDAKPRSQGWGTPPPDKDPVLLKIWNSVLDGQIWEIGPQDHRLRPRQFYLKTREMITRATIRAMVTRRGHLVYVRNLEDHDPRDVTVHALNGRTPTLKFWALPQEVSAEQAPEPGDEPDPVPDAVAAFVRPLAKRESAINVPAKQLEPYVLTALNTFFEAALTNSEILRVVDHLVHDAGTDTRGVHHQQLRRCLQSLVDDEDTPIYARLITDHERRAMGIGNTATQLYSPTTPVPIWSADVHERIMADYGDPRPLQVTRERRRTIIEQPRYTVTTSRPPLHPTPEQEIRPVTVSPVLPHPPIHESSLRDEAAVISRQLIALVARAETASGPELQITKSQLAGAREQITELKRQVTDITRERDEARRQLQQIIDAQRALAQLLNQT